MIKLCSMLNEYVLTDGEPIKRWLYYIIRPISIDWGCRQYVRILWWYHTQREVKQ